MMRHLMLVLGLAIAVPAMAGSFDGTWRADVSQTQLNTPLRIWNISNGVYRCSSCKPSFTVRADGKPHSVPVGEGFDAESVSVVDDRTVLFKEVKGGQTIGTYKLAAMPDGKSLRVTSQELGANGMVVTSQKVERRIAAAPKGSHPASGTWKDAKIERADESILTITMKETDGVLHLKQGTGESYAARIGGPAVPVKGDREGTMVSLRRTAPMTLVETDTVKGKVVGVSTMILVNPTTMKFVGEDKRTGGVEHWVAHKT
jgi:hypothetical protein